MSATLQRSLELSEQTKTKRGTGEPARPRTPPGNPQPATPSRRLLSHLGLAPEAPSLDYLDRLVREHQLRVPFETLTKLLDYEPGLRSGCFLPHPELYVDRIVRHGAGGVCWTLARGFHSLLVELGFDASLMMMNPGHCCVRVELPEGPYYADVGYAAPLFRAHPLFESFALATHREAFDYRVRPEGIVVTRRPGPTKQLDPTPRRLEDLTAHIAAANDWSVPHSFLHRLIYARTVGGVFTSFRDGTLTRHAPDGPEVTAVDATAAPRVLAQVFGVDPDLYRAAEAVRMRYGRPPA
ncbi:MAG TPA: arylamine N-acetyltransferase [Burkholderiaceae bacterium]|nr:arylamine N-acetyltransferase [Burkholderiaceae bacterium]